MKLSERIISEAKERGLQHFFGLPSGGALLDLIEAGRRAGVEFISVAHESSAPIIAAYYGMMKGTAGLAVAIKGVGAGNLAGGAVNAYFERIPVVCLCESSSPNETQGDMVQKCNHTGLFNSVAKSISTLTSDNGLAELKNAVFHATDGRPGPVLLNLPSVLASQKCADRLPETPSAEITEPEEALLKDFRDLVQSSRRPVVIAGQDVVRAGVADELLTFVENIGAAVLVNIDARGVISETHPRWAGVTIGNYTPNLIETEIFNQADLVIPVGADPMMCQAAWACSLPTCELVARADYQAYSSNPKVRVDGNLKTALQNLSSLKQPGFSEEEILSTRRRILRLFKRPEQAGLAAQDVIEITRAALPPDGMLFAETGGFVCMLEHLWPVTQPGTFWTTTGGRTMGLTLPAILGSKMARPDIPMVGIGGDGSLLMRLGELEVFARSGVAVPLVIINDRALGTIKSRQKSRGLPDHGLDLHSVDFAAVARGCGLYGATVETPDEFEVALQEAMRADRTTLIDARVDPLIYQDSFGPTVGVLNSTETEESEDK